MKFHLINPKLPLSFAGNEYAAPMVFKKYSTPPLGLLTVAGMIPDHHQVTFCDENVSTVDYSVDCDVVGLTGMHLQGQGIRHIATEFRKRGKKVIVGGPSCMAVPERYRDIADILMVGEAEQTWPECIADLERGTARDTYKPTDTVDLRTSPVPRFELVSPRDYLSISLQTTRGCPFKCEFCDIITLYGRKVRTKPVEQVVREVERVLALGWDRLFFVDDNFIGDPRYTAELMEALTALQRRLTKPFYFSTQATINVAHNQQLLQQLYDGGCRSMFIGIETPRTSSLQETHKYQNVRKNTLDEVARIQAQGIAVYSGLIVGFDHDDDAIFDEQVDFINAARIPLPLPSMLGALPATPLYERMKAEGRLIPEHEFQGNSYFTNILPKQFTMEGLERGYKGMVRNLYSPENYSARVLGELENLNKAEGGASNYRFLTLLAGYLWVLGWYIVDPNRVMLLKAFFKIAPAVLTKYPKVADAGLQRLVMYRHVRHFVNMVERRESTRTTNGRAAAQHTVSVPA
ncbi:MAG: radical SAM protein [Vicinamibacterales bacterium]